jgi:hypothetical protein
MMIQGKYNVISPFSSIETISNIDVAKKYTVRYKENFVNKSDKLRIYISDEFINLKQYFNKLDFIEIVDDINDYCLDYIYCSHNSIYFVPPKKGLIIKGNIESINTSNCIKEFKYTYDNNNYYFLRNKNSSYIFNDLSFIVQGLDTENTIELLSILFIYAKIILSTWSQYDFNNIKKQVETKYIYNNNNIYYQVYTTLNGLEKVSTLYSVKIRSDEFYLDFNTFINSLYEHPNKIVVADITIRRSQKIAYKFCDHIIGGLTKNLLDMFKQASYLITNNIANTTLFHYDTWSSQQILSLGYLSNVYPMNTLSIDKSESLMTKHFLYINVYSFKMFKIIYTRENLRLGSRKIEVHVPNFHIHCVSN